jgi:hypothetical protein
VIGGPCRLPRLHRRFCPSTVVGPACMATVPLFTCPGCRVMTSSKPAFWKFSRASPPRILFRSSTSWAINGRTHRNRRLNTSTRNQGNLQGSTEEAESKASTCYHKAELSSPDHSLNSCGPRNGNGYRRHTQQRPANRVSTGPVPVLGSLCLGSECPRPVVRQSIGLGLVKRQRIGKIRCSEAGSGIAYLQVGPEVE